MANRQTAPQFLGVLKNDENAPQGWIRTVWRLPSGELRYAATKAVLVAKNDSTGEYLMQQKLVDVHGNEI